MIRDLRFEEIEHSERRKRLVRLSLSLVLVSTVATFVVHRERQIRAEWQRLPVVQKDDVDSLKLRRDGIERVLERRSFWTGVFQATKERDELVVAIHNEERLAARAGEAAEQAKRRQMEEAEASRTRGLQHVERHDFERAIEQFERALSVAGPSWEHSEQLRVDLAALNEWKSDQGRTQGTPK